MIIDIDMMIKETGIENGELLKTFIKDFFDICSRDISKISECIENGDNESLVRYANNISGVAYRLRLGEIYTAASLLEKAAREMEISEYDKLAENLLTVFKAGSEECIKLAS